MINVGVAGIGFMGWIHYLAYEKVESARITAIASRSPKKLAGDWTGIQGNFGPPGRQVDLNGIKTYSNLDELLEDTEIDLIDNCLPPHLHADFSIRALEAGKHVLCEKPMALLSADCDRMVATAERVGKQILVGHVLPFFPEYAFARKVAESGEYGRLVGGNFKRIIADPLWLDDFFDADRVGGPLVDLHVHDAHFIRMMFGMPTTLFSQGRLRGDVVEHCSTLFGFSDPQLAVTATSGVINQQGRDFTHAYELHFEKATLHFDFAAFKDAAELMPLKILPADASEPEAMVLRPDLGDGDPVGAFVAEIEEVVRSLEANAASPILSGVLARDAIHLCHKQTESVKRRTQVGV
ncbi:MAG TPA: Gfo/Idh/MocA family oxidoreductase [Pirellulaceae bacterium]|nr:Gfo/Idh/MocA family oxidoreductase [Pirellulaceae bacterium]